MTTILALLTIVVTAGHGTASGGLAASPAHSKLPVHTIATAKSARQQIPLKPITGPFAQAKSWGYQLRGIDPLAIARSSYDVVVIDFAKQERPFSRAEVEIMRGKPDGGRRIVLAYLSIGEAERYRSYWKSAWNTTPPAWLGPENPQWRGNFPVRFWESDWQNVIFGTANAYLDQIIAAGFDGAYLDRVDVYSEWEKEKLDAELAMVGFVAAISTYAKILRSEFLIVPQNAEELLVNDVYLRAIDAVAKEDLLYGIDHSGGVNPAETVAASIGLLRRARQAGKMVMVVEYLCRREEIAVAERRIAGELGFLPYVAPRTLHSLGLDQDDVCLPPGPLGRRIALLIGSAAYQHAEPVPRAAAGVRTLATALRQAGFTQVRERIDLGRDSISQELQRFTEAAREADWAIVYYAGLGINLSGRNYLVPVSARLDRPADVELEAVPLDEAERAVEPAKQVRIVFVDACRSNPFLQQMQRRGMTQAAGPGVRPGAARPALAMAFASRCDGAPVAPAWAPEVGTGELYAEALARHLLTPGLELPWLMERVRDSVLRATRGAQDPVHVGVLPDGAMFTAPTTPSGPR